MEARRGIHCAHARHLDIEELRGEFVVEQVFQPSEITMTNSHIDRIIHGGIVPLNTPLAFSDAHGESIGIDFYLERGELGIVNAGGPGMVVADGATHSTDAPFPEAKRSGRDLAQPVNPLQRRNESLGFSLADGQGEPGLRRHGSPHDFRTSLNSNRAALDPAARKDRK